MEETEKKWIFIEKSSETVRYKKVGDSDSSMDECQDYEYLPAQDTPSPFTFEIISSKPEELAASGDELEIHDNHFSSCPTSEMEDSDIEVVIKSPSSSETASLCSFNSQKSIPNDASLPYDEMLFTSQKSVVNDALLFTSQKSVVNDASLPYDETLFNAEMAERLGVPTSAVETGVHRDNEEEDSEVEVISRSIHRNGSIEISYVAEMMNNHDASLNTSISSGSENENDEAEGGMSSLCIPPISPAEEEQGEVVEEPVDEDKEDGEEEERGILQSYDHNTEEEEGDSVESLEDYGIKYLLEDIHVSRQINGRLVGLKTSTLALTVCLSITLGVYLGNFMNPDYGHLLDNDDGLLVPDDVHSTADDPPRVNITFRYSSSTRESLKSILHSFRKLKSDYDRLHVAYAEIKERCSRKKQMSIYWRKQAKQGLMEHGEHVVNVSTNRNIHKTIQQPNTVLKSNIQTTCSLSNDTCQAHQNTIRKLSRDLINERKSTKYWKKRYRDAEFSRLNTCSRYDDPKTASFSFSDCFNIFSKVIPSLDIGVINITNRAENLADRVQNAWTRLSSRWNAKKVPKADDPIYLRKVNRFRRIFIISNVVSSGHQFRHHLNTDIYKNETMEYNMQPDTDMDVSTSQAGVFSEMNETACEETETESVTSTDEHSINQSLNKTRNHYDTNRDRKNADVNYSTCYNDETKWYKSKFQESRFLFDVYKWKNIFKSEMDSLRSQHISHLLSEKEKQSRTIEKLRRLEHENEKQSRMIVELRRLEQEYKKQSRAIEVLRRFEHAKQSRIIDELQRIEAEHEKQSRTIEELRRLEKEHEKQSRTIEELQGIGQENVILQGKVKSNEERMERAQKKMKYLMFDEVKRCNSTIVEVRSTMEGNCRSVVEEVQDNVKQAEKSKYEERIRDLFANERKRYELSIENIKKVTRNEEKSKFIKKLHVMKESLERNKQNYNKLKRKYKNKKMRRKSKKKKRHYIEHRNQHRRNFKAHGDARQWNEYGPLTEQAYKNLENNRRLGHSTRRNENKLHRQFYFLRKSRRSENYARKYKQSVKEVGKLRSVYDEAVKKTKLQEEIIEDYKHQMERYKEIIREYEHKMNEVSERERQQKEELLHLAGRMKTYEEKMSRENSMRSLVAVAVPEDEKETISDDDAPVTGGGRFSFSTPRSEENTIMIAGPMSEEGTITITGPVSEDEVITISGPITAESLFMRRTGTSEEDVEATNASETQHDYISEMSGSKCGKDPDRKPFYNIEDVYPSDLFGRAIDIRAPSPPKTSIMLPSPPLVSPVSTDRFHIQNAHRREETLFDSSTFAEDLSFSATNESQIINDEISIRWDNTGVKFSEYSRNENSDKWYEDEEGEEESGPTLGPDAPKRETRGDVEENRGEINWFWRAMKGREEIRSSQQHGDMNWFWKFMKEREHMRSSQQGDVNWFWKAMKEREKRRAHAPEENWFWKSMREREKIREGGVDD